MNPRVKIAYLRSYRLRTPDIGPPPARLSAKPVSVEPDGSGWYQIEEILDHRGPATNNGECLSDITRAQAARKHLESFIGRACVFSVLRRQSK